MRLAPKLTLSLMAVASLVAVVGLLFDATGDLVLEEVESVEADSLVEVVGATEMMLALQASQLAAQELIAERYRARVEPDHTSEWGSAGDIDVEAVYRSLREFEVHLRQTRGGAARPEAVGDAPGDEATALEAARLLEIERQFKVYKRLIDRFIHLARYHPSDRVRAFVDDELRPHYRDVLLVALREYRQAAGARLGARVAEIRKTMTAGIWRNRLIAVGALLTALVLGLVLARSISGPLTHLAEAVKRFGREGEQPPIEVRGGREISLLTQAFNRMVADLRATTVSRAYLDNILQSLDDMLLVVDAEGRIQTANRVAGTLLGYDLEELRERPIGSLLVLEDASPGVAGRPEATGPAAMAGEGEALARGGERIPVAWTRSELREENGTTSGAVYLVRDIRSRKEAEARLRKSLAEKEVLLKEVHHRVKNNLQIISSLVRLQGQGVVDESLRRSFRESQNRIRSMALIHEQLYRSDDLAHIDLDEYLRALLRHVEQSYDAARRGIRIRLRVDWGPVEIDAAIACGMIVNELVSNAIEHAFPESGGEVAVALELEGGARTLSVRDNGRGLPSDLDPLRARSLGLKLVGALAGQLGGRLEHSVEGGTCFVVRCGVETAREVTLS